jgi:hypothetical protein
MGGNFRSFGPGVGNTSHTSARISWGTTCRAVADSQSRRH